MMVHQIWLGNAMPPEDRADADCISRACARARVDYKLWGQEALWQRYGTEPAVRELDRLRPHLPAARFAALAADWFRLRVLAEFGGVYFDTDMQLNTGELPPLPAACDLYFFPDHKREDGCSNCAIVAVGEHGQEAAGELAELAAQQLRGMSVQACAGKWSLMWAIGPTWLRKAAFPALSAKGFSVGLLPRTLCSEHGGTLPLNHRGTGKWVRAQGAAMPAPDTRPAWQRPRATVVLPPRRKTLATPPQTLGMGAATPLLTVPQGTRSAVLLANTQGYTLAGLSLGAGDIVVHFNRCRHKAEAMAAAPQAEHWCIVRRGQPGAWFPPADFSGFARVIFVDSALNLTAFAWYNAYRAATSKSPTTGFLTALCLHELYPTLPLVLAGFSPARHAGSPMWSGHAWDYEAAELSKQPFTIISPAL